MLFLRGNGWDRMTKFAAKVTSRGRITIDSKVRSELGLEDGDWVVAKVKPIDGDRVRGSWVLADDPQIDG